MTSTILSCVLMIFVRNVKHKFKAGCGKWIKCSFTIENIQKS